MATVISSGTSTITKGTTLYSPDIYNSGAVVISSGGVVSGAIVRNGGRETVSSGGTDYNATVSSGGAIYVRTSGFVYNPTIINKGYISAYGGRVHSATIGLSASLELTGWSSGGSTVYGYASSGTIVNYGQLVLNDYSTADDFKISSGFVYVYGGGTLQTAIIGSGAGSSKDAEVYIKNGGVGRVNYIYSNGIMVVSNGGSAASTRVYSGGSLVASSGGVLNWTSASGGVVDVKPGGKATSTSIESNGGFYVSEGAIVSGTTITSGRMYLMSSATAYETILKAGTFTNYADSISGTFSGGTAYLSGGSSYHEKMLGGVMEVSSYGGRKGYATALDVSSATVYLNSDTSLNIGYVSSGGKLYVYEGARASSVNVYTGGDVFVKSGGYLSGGSIYGSEVIMSGASAYDMTVQNQGTLDVRGKVYSCTVAGGGKAIVSSGAAFTAKLMSSGARISAMSGGTAVISSISSGSAVVSGGSVYVSGGVVDYAGIYGGFLNASTGTNVLDAFVSSGGLYILNGAKCASALVVAGSDSANLTINSGGSVSYVNVSGGSARLNVGGSVFNANVLFDASATFSGQVNSCLVYSGAKASVSSGGFISSVTVAKDAFLKVYNAGKASNVIISSGGDLVVSSGGTAMETTVGSSGVMTISSGGSVVSGVTVTSGGWLRIASSGYADAIILTKNGEMQIEGGTIDNLLVMKDCRAIVSGGSIISATLATGGSAFCYKTGRMAGTVSSGGTAIFSGGMATGLTMINGGKVKIADTLNMLAGDAINFSAGGTLDFDISKITASGYAALLTGYNDHILYGGNAVYTLTIDGYGSQKDMTYKLASNASLFNSTIAVYDTFGTSLGTLTVGSKTLIGDKDYTLNLDGDNVLSVSVADAAPTPAGVVKGDIDGNGVSDVLFQYTGGDYQLGYWMNGTNEWRGQGLAKPAVWEVLGSYDMNSNGKADAVLVGNVTTEIGGKGAYIGYYLDSVDSDSNWQNIGYLNNEEDIAWKNKVGNLTGNAGKNSIVWYAPELFALGAWTDSTTEWINISASFGGDGWTLVGCGDFNGDGKDSVVMNYNKGQLFYEVEIGGKPAALGSADWRGWEIRAIGDFAGDGKEDIVLFHEDTGSMVMCANGNLDSFVSIGQLAADDWFVVGAGDYNADAKDDLLVRQKSTGMLGYYVCGDTSQWVEMGRGVDTAWTVIA